MKTVLHLFLKDVRQMRRLLVLWLALLAVQLASCLAEKQTTIADWDFLLAEGPKLPIWTLLHWIGLVGLVFEVLLADRAFGPEPCWKTRPIARWQMATAKCAFIAAEGPSRPVLAPDWLTWLPAVVLGVGGWVVVGCRYLTRGWRATYIVGLLALLVALVAGHGGVVAERVMEREVPVPFHAPVSSEPEVFFKRLPRSPQAAALAVQLHGITQLGTNSGWAAHGGIDFGEGRVLPVMVKPDWTVARAATGMLALGRLSNLFPAAPTNRPTAYHGVGWERAYDVIFATLGATNELAAALPELSGYRLTANADADEGRLYLNPKVAADMQRAPQAVTAEFQVAFIEARTVATVPLRQGASGRAGEMRFNVQRGPGLRHEGVIRHLVTRQPYRGVRESSLQHHHEPDLFVFRNPVTKEAFLMEWNEVGNWRNYNHTAATLLSPARRHLFAVWERPLTGHPSDNRRRFSEAWLDQAEVLGVRLTLVGWSQRTVRLENFQLEPAAR